MGDNEVLEELNENLNEDTEVSNDDTEVSSLVQEEESPPDPSEETEHFEKSLEDLLKEYIENSISDDSTEVSEDGELSEGINNDSEETSIDYTDMLNKIIVSNEDISSYSEHLYAQQIQQNVNNTLSSDIESISLTNFLLLAVFVAILFNALMNFAGGFFK